MLHIFLNFGFEILVLSDRFVAVLLQKKTLWPLWSTISRKPLHNFWVLGLKTCLTICCIFSESLVWNTRSELAVCGRFTEKKTTLWQLWSATLRKPLHNFWVFGLKTCLTICCIFSESLVLKYSFWVAVLWPFYCKKRHFGNFDRRYCENRSITFEILV